MPYDICLGGIACRLRQKADENKPIADVKAEAEGMSVEQLRDKAMAYKDAIVAKKAEIGKITARLKEIPISQALGEEAKGLKADINALNESVANLSERFEIYYDKLKELGGDTSGLDI